LSKPGRRGYGQFIVATNREITRGSNKESTAQTETEPSNPLAFSIVFTLSQ